MRRDLGRFVTIGPLLSQVNRLIVQHQVIQRPLRVAARLAVARNRIIPGAATAVIVNWNSSE